MKKHLNKALAILLAILLMLSLAACGQKEEPTPTDTDDPTVAAPGTDEGDDTDTPPAAGFQQGDTGVGPVALDTRYAVIEIPAEVDYEIYMITPEESVTGTVRIDFGYGDTDSYIEVSSSRMVSSIDDAVQECIRMHSFGDPDSATIGGDVVYNGVTYKTVSFPSRDAAYLVSYYEEPSDEYSGRYVEVYAYTTKIELDDDVIVSILESIVYK